MSSSYRIELDKWLSQLDVTANTVLDIGGSQLPVKGRTKSWDVKKYAIADLPEPHADSNKPDIELDLNSESSGLAKEYDLIFCLEVFDYVFNPVNAMEIIQLGLKPNGRAWVTFPFVYPTHNPIEADMLRYTEFAVRKLAEVSKLEIKQIIPRRPETNAIDNLWRAERMRAAKHYDHNVTGWIVELERRKSLKPT